MRLGYFDGIVWGEGRMLGQFMSWLLVLEHELLLFAGFWIVLGSIDDIGVDALWLWLKLSGRAKTGVIDDARATAPLSGHAAVIIAAWQESAVIGHTLRHALSVWSQRNVTIYVGCYCNDPATIEAAMQAAGGDPRVRVVIHGRAGPTTKADCLNRLYAAICEDDARRGSASRFIMMHDAEDMVHAAELAAVDAALSQADYVQLPVRPEPQRASRWVAGHYTDEFTEAHAKVLVVRDALGAAIPAAGVGCAFTRPTLERIAAQRRAEGGDGPFAGECLTEDYELGMLVWRAGGRSRYLRLRDERGALVATRAYFPAALDASVRQKTRWILGIAFQGWDRLGWGHRPSDWWMVLRDRRGPLAAFVFACAYGLLLVEAVLGGLRLWGFVGSVSFSPVLTLILTLCWASLIWRCVNRFAFTSAEYGVWEGLLSIPRGPVANIIAIMAGYRALARYLGSLRGAPVTWDKTSHDEHPAMQGSLQGAMA